MNTSTNPKSSFLMPDSNVSVTSNWAHPYLNITSEGIVSANNELRLMGRDTPVDLVIPAEINGIKVIGIKQNGFRSCSSLTSVTIPEGVTEIAAYSFIECNSLTSITIPDTVTSIRDHAFEGCVSLIKVNIPTGGLISIGEGAFQDCHALRDVTIPLGVTEIGANAFNGCTDLSLITIPYSVTTIGEDAFAYCDIVFIQIYKPSGSISGAPWGAPSTARIYWS